MKTKSKLSSISINGLKLYKGKVILLIISLILTNTLLFISSGYLDLDYHHTMQREMDRYGSYQYVVDRATDSQLEELENPFFEKNTMKVYGSNEYGNIGSIDQYHLIPLKLIEGRMPEKDHEVTIEQGLIDVKLNDMIDITYHNLNQEEITDSYKVVGIINNYSDAFVAYYNSWEKTDMDNGGYAINESTEVYNGDSLQYIINETNLEYDAIVFYRGDSKLPKVNGNNVYGNTATVSMKNAFGEESIYRENTMLRESVMFFLLLLTTIISYFGVSQLNEAQRSRFILLRSIGATSFQLLRINLYQLCIVLAVSLPFSLVTSYIEIYTLAHYFQYEFIILYEHILECIFIIVLGMLFGLALPIITTITASLTKRKKSVKKVRISKAKPLHLLRLAARHNYINMKSNIIFVLIMVAGIDTIVMNLNNLFFVKEDEYLYNITINIQGELSERNQRILDEFDYPSVINFHSSEIREKEVNGDLIGVHYIICNPDQSFFNSEEERNAFINGECIFVEYTDFYIDMKTGGWYDANVVNGDKSSYIHNYVSPIEVGDEIDGLKIIDSSPTTLTDGYYVQLSEIAAQKIGIKMDSKSIAYYFNNNEQYTDILNTVYKIKADPAVIEIENYYELYMAQITTQTQKNIKYAMISCIAGIILLIMIFERYSTEVLSRKRELSLYRAIGMEEDQLLKKVLLEVIELLIFILLISMIPMLIYIVDQPSILIIYAIVLLILLVICISSYYLPIKADLKEPILKELRMRE